MDKLSDYIPLLLIVGSVLISLVQSANKKRQGQEAKKTMLPKGIPTMSERQTEVSRPVVLPKMRSVLTDRLKEHAKASPSIDVFNPEVNRSVASVPDSQTVDGQADFENPVFVFDTTDAENIKRAVIYSEILNRKEF